MDLKSGYPFWAVKNGLMHAFPALKSDITCDVAVLGGGITGALIADELSANGHDTVVLDQRDIAWGSTAASTALLQYEIDTHLVDLSKQYGEEAAVLAYKSCSDAIDLLAEKATQVRDVDFARMRSLYYASHFWHRGALVDEYNLRKKHGFHVQLLERGEVSDRYGFSASVAILSQQAARIDPYRMAYKLLMQTQKNGGNVFDRTEIVDINTTSRGAVLKASNGTQVRAKHVVMASGYACQKYLQANVAQNRSSYAFVTDPIESDVLGPLADTMVWESARPYLYMRSTGDGRLVVGGDDDALDIPLKRDAMVDRKARKLAKKVSKLFPNVPVEPAFAWGGTFAETEDGLPWFGAHKETGPRMLFAMAYGGNGITYSALGAGLIRALVERKKHPLSGIFGFER